MADERKVVVVGDGLHSAAAMAALLAGGLSGHQAIILQDDPYRDIDRMIDTLDVLSVFAPSAPRPRRSSTSDRGRVVSAMFNGLTGRVQHIDTPKPISKRKARRLRGKAAQNG